ncbi:hypothetical protein MMC25_006614 [Agyrium rufum]|nr:hypothetical protein [Agyrium rufum]
MESLYGTIAWTITLLLGLYVVRNFFNEHVYFRNVRKNGREHPPRYRHSDPILGTDLYRNIVKHMSEGNASKVAKQRFMTMGKTFEANSLGTRVIFTMDPKNIQAVLATNFPKYGVEPRRKAFGGKRIGQAIIMKDGSEWRHARKVLKPLFVRAQVGDLKLVGKHVDRLMDLLPRDSSMLDLQALFQKLLLDTSTEFLFGSSTDSLLPNSFRSDAKRFIKAFDTTLRGTNKRLLLGRFARFLGRDRTFENACTDVRACVNRYIDAALQHREELLISSEKNSVRQPFVFVDELMRETQDQKFLRDQLLNVFFPARDSAYIGITEPLTFELLKSINYLTWTLNECFRLCSPVSFALRTCLTDDILPTGGGPQGTSPIFVRAGTNIDIDFQVMQLDEDLWGSDADQFCPERREQGLLPAWHYIPFLGGQRVCPAQQMIYVQYAYLLVRFAKEFTRLENRDDTLEFVEEYRMTKQSRNGVKVAFLARCSRMTSGWEVTSRIYAFIMKDALG